MLTLNSARVLGHNLKIRANFRIETKELSGQSSASDRSEEGIKPVTLAVTLEIHYKNSDDLTRLIALARSTDDNGNMTIYQIVTPIAEVCKIREVTFTDNFNVAEHDQLQLWQIAFTLAEHRTVAEKSEQRQPQPTAVEQDSGNDLASTLTPPANDEEQLTGFKAVLKKWDDALA
ncbi:DNA-binding protein [Bacterioplanoides sp.]|uniref:baseplate complex protein n=1 Tax=Bacterioplanoides sp. TaxID=2066072 RepID=UPI003B5920EE